MLLPSRMGRGLEGIGEGWGARPHPERWLRVQREAGLCPAHTVGAHGRTCAHAPPNMPCLPCSPTRRSRREGARPGQEPKGAPAAVPPGAQHKRSARMTTPLGCAQLHIKPRGKY